jgi:hypothetical protein
VVCAAWVSVVANSEVRVAIGVRIGNKATDESRWCRVLGPRRMHQLVLELGWMLLLGSGGCREQIYLLSASISWWASPGSYVLYETVDDMWMLWISGWDALLVQCQRTRSLLQ